jgi:Na+-transporting NADH:ubiquinone oxidoreductase subunit B
MKPLRKFLDKIKPNFQKGGKLYFLHSVFDGFETFLFVPDHVTKRGSHIRDSIDLKRTMIMVVIALVPALLFGIFNVGVQYYLAQYHVRPEYSSLTWNEIIPLVGFWKIFFYGFIKVLPIIIVSYVTGLGVEFIFAQIRGHSINEGFLVSGLLIPLVVPPDIPLWMVAVATVFAVIFGKEVFGGTGMNIMNPALLTRAFLFFAYPAHMSGDNVWIAAKPDAVSGATPLALSASGHTEVLPSAMDMFLGFIPGSVGETSALAILLGAFILIYTGIGSFRIMAATVAGGLFMGWIFNLSGANAYMLLPSWYHLIMGGFAFGAVFMATDPVTATQTARGKLIYGFLIGIFAVLLRVVNPAYPEGMMLAILFMNVMAPLIDHYVVQSHIRHRMKRALKFRSNVQITS